MRYRYTKYVPSHADALDLEQLVAKLSDLLLASGFHNPWDPSDAGDRTLQALHDAILDALFGGGVLPEDAWRRLLDERGVHDPRAVREALDALVAQIVERLQQAGYIAPAADPAAARPAPPAAGGRGDEPRRVRFEVTDKALDFLGYRALRDLLGARGRGAVGRHDTRELAAGIETGGAPKPFEWGDALNLDAPATILNAVARARAEGRPLVGDAPPVIDVREEDLRVAQGDYQASCATVLLLDCSHSMILYGEDRFTPAKRVALALAHLIRTQFPGDTLHAVLFHDSAEQVPVREIGRVRVGPYYTNTREGLRLARRLLDRERKDLRQIVMVTDGKPSAVTQPDGRIYRNPFGLDPLVLGETFAEVSRCARSGIAINTFMLARDYDLVAFVRRVAAMCRGKAYFTTPFTLGRYLLQDYLDRKTRTIH